MKSAMKIIQIVVNAGERPRVRSTMTRMSQMTPNTAIIGSSRRTTCTSRRQRSRVTARAASRRAGHQSATSGRDATSALVVEVPRNHPRVTENRHCVHGCTRDLRLTVRWSRAFGRRARSAIGAHEPSRLPSRDGRGGQEWSRYFPVITKCPRRFCAQQDSPVAVQNGDSFPRLTVWIRWGLTPRLVR